MTKFVVFGTILLCFVSYGLLPLGASVLFGYVSEDPLAAIAYSLLWGFVVLLQIIAMWKIFRGNRAGLHLFFSTIFIYIILYASDQILLCLEKGAALPWADIANKAIFPLIVAWLLYFSDVKSFFNQSTESSS